MFNLKCHNSIINDHYCIHELTTNNIKLIVMHNYMGLPHSPTHSLTYLPIYTEYIFPKSILLNKIHDRI
ncbi:unnamed protein product [Schistosoma mansoni]|uniref:Smp_201870 n=1 Tax=Schistosoma mansoni TaxID=6183 RepID=G4LVD8_SCHMA|nr:unnamed protein product [Schistosoma mansoni]|eukprot:XP_018645236.1 unnamed protein product [Schistosoma mansoni]